MPDFTKTNPYNSKANFSSVKFGADAPLLETELQEMQSILRNQTKESLKLITGDCIVGSGSYSIASNKLTVANERVILDGEIITVNDAKINVAEGDTIYLVAWYEERTHEDLIKEYGNVDSSTTVLNKILDERIGEETSRREQLVYRLSNICDDTKMCLELGTVANNSFKITCPIYNANSFTNGIEGSYITAKDTVEGKLTNIKVLGNTVQDTNNLVDIKSTGIDNGDGTFKYELVTCGKNLINNHTIIPNKVLSALGTIDDNENCNVSDYIRIKEGQRFILPSGINSTGRGVVIYNHKKEFVKSVGLNTPVNTPCAFDVDMNGYMRVSLWQTQPMMMFLGSDLHDYEPYKETRATINLPCQLEKVGDISDVLYYDGVEKNWCVDKSVTHKKIKDNESIVTSVADTGTHYYMCLKKKTVLPNVLDNTVLVSNTFICKKYPSSISYDKCIVYTNDEFYVYISKSEFEGTPTNSDFLSKMVQYNTIIHYLTSPQKIILPKDVQISLNSFFGTTNVYLECGEVEGTIIANIPKSVEASVVSNTKAIDVLEKRVEDIEVLKEGQNISYETDKGYIICKDTKQSVIQDVKIEGKTLVNIAKELSYSEPVTICDIDITKNYTFILNKITTDNQLNCRFFYSDGTRGDDYAVVSSSTNGYIVKLVDFSKSDKDKTVIGFGLYLPGLGVGDGGYSDFMVLEGDHTDLPPSYFEGLCSVGSDVDVMEVSTRKEDGNLFDINKITKNVRVKENDGTLLENTNCFATDFIFIEEGETYYLGTYKYPFDGYYTSLYDRNYNFVQHLNIGSTGVFTSPITGYLRTTGMIANLEDNAIISKGSLISYEPHKSHSKQLLYKNAEGDLVPITELHKWDSVEKHSDGKYYYHKRSDKVVFDGSESWGKGSVSGPTNTLRFDLFSITNLKASSTLICDKFLNRSGYSVDVEGVYSGGSDGKTFSVYIFKSKLSTSNSEGFKAWLAINNVTVVYQLATEEVYEIAPLDLDIYDGETLVNINSGAICPSNLSFNLNSHIGNIVKQVQEETRENTKVLQSLTQSMTAKSSSTNGYALCENTKEGVVDEIKVEGNTLVNLSTRPTITDNFTNAYFREHVICEVSKLSLNKPYTFVIFKTYGTNHNLAYTRLEFGTGAGQGSAITQHPSMTINGSTQYVQDYSASTTEIIVLSLNFSDFKGQSHLMWRPCRRNSTPVATEYADYTLKSILLEGDHTNNPPRYFEGLKSVGDLEDTIEVTSRKEDGNLYDITTINKFKVVHVDTGELVTNENHCTDFIRVYPSTTYYSNRRNSSGVALYDAQKRFIQHITIPNSDFMTYNFTSDTVYVRMNIGVTSTDTFIFSSSKQLIEGCIITQNRTLMYRDTNGEVLPIKSLRKVSEDVKDTIEKHSNGKYYYHKRCEEVVLNGSENWLINTATPNQTNTKAFYSSVLNIKTTRGNLPNLLSDRFLTVTSPYFDINDGLSISMGDTPTYSVMIRHSSVNVSDFKKWLETNNTTVVYQLAQEEVYEVVNLDLNSYEGETSVFTNTLIPPTNLEVSMSSNIQDVLNSLKLRMSDLEKGVGYISKDGYSGWTRLPNGLLLQWGSTSNSPGSAEARINFPIAFTSGFFTSHFTGQWVHSHDHYWTHSNTDYKTFMTAYKHGDYSITDNVFWFAIGI